MDEDYEEMFDKKDLRKRKEKKRSHKHEKEYDEFGKDGLKKMKQEIDDLRKRELERTRELEELKKKIDDRDKKAICQQIVVEYALQFSKDIYLSKGFIESAKWIKDVVAKNMIEKMNDETNKKRFEIALLNKKHSTCLGIRTCARYNRGEVCNFGKWHTTHKPETHWSTMQKQRLDEPIRGTYGEYRQRNLTRQSNEECRQPIQDRLGAKNEIRLHSCTLCMEALGTASGHNVLNCPWILQNNWKQ